MSALRYERPKTVSQDYAVLLASRKPKPPEPEPEPGPPRPKPKQRAPLPPFDETLVEGDPPQPHPVYTEMWQQIPPAPDVRWWRGDAWGVTVPGLPLAEGCVPESQERVLTYFLGRYGRQWEDPILNAHLERGYTHFSLSPQDEIAMGMSEDDYVAMSVRVRQAGFFVHHLMRSKYYSDPNYNPADQDPLIDKLLSAGAMQVETPSWEMNWASPDKCQEVIDHDSERIGMACSIMLHFFPHYISWPNPPPDDSAKFWHRQHGKVDGLLYQCDPSWSAGMMAARINDGLVRLCPGGMYGLGDSGRGHPIDIVAWELIASWQFWNKPDGNGRLSTEDQGNLKGYEILCAPGPMPPMGIGNGGRWPDGMWL